MKFPIYYLVPASQGVIHKRDGLDTSFTGTVANVTVSNCAEYELYNAGRLEWLRKNA